MMELPITEKELETIINIMRSTNPSLYAKLWSYKINYLKKEKEDGFS
jgi:hypothetical protein